MTDIVDDMDSPVRPLHSNPRTQSYGSFQRQGTDNRLRKQGTGFQKIELVSYKCTPQKENVKFIFCISSTVMFLAK